MYIKVGTATIGPPCILDLASFRHSNLDFRTLIRNKRHFHFMVQKSHFWHYGFGDGLYDVLFYRRNGLLAGGRNFPIGSRFLGKGHFNLPHSF